MTRVLHTAMRKVNGGADTGVSACTTEGAGLMSWSSQAIREASRVGDYGKVVRLARAIRRVSQKQLGEACGTSQSAVSRLEKRGADSYDTAQLARAAQHLQIPPHLVGLADHTAALAVKAEGTDVERRNFLAGAAAVAAAASLRGFPGYSCAACGRRAGCHTACGDFSVSADGRLDCLASSCGTSLGALAVCARLGQ